ncbi:MAG TPA: ATP phosphoribosyltransferase regulatory subunit, partial [Clostridia bacterium]|nr:ATP phosphoribosyltransferase regulatory subunit [Clostridia bacterium]
NISTLKKEEKVALRLRNIYEAFGYRKYNMSRFEEYSFYMDYKSFLPSDRIISFTDMDGKLLALKPDVTLSIVKNAKELKDSVEKLYYIENVYKPDKNSGKFKEISQIGLEAMCPIDSYTTLEVINLAIKSLDALEDDFVLDLSHIGIVMGLLNSEQLKTCDCKDKILECIVSKNLHDLNKLMEKCDVSNDLRKKFEMLITIGGTLGEALDTISKIVVDEETEKAYQELESVYQSLIGTPYENKVKVDFSIINDVNYYCGIIFQGYVRQVPHMILSGGRYDLLLQKLGKDVGAIGFALAMDDLQLYYPEDKLIDADAVILYDKEADAKKLYAAVESLTKKGLKVKAQTSLNDGMKYGKLYRFVAGKLEEANV